MVWRRVLCGVKGSVWCEGFCVVWRRVLCGVKGSVWCGEG